jgi:hypothetical protein
MGFPFPDFNVLKTNMYEVVLLACADCGAIRLHMRRGIAEWAEKNPPH